MSEEQTLFPMRLQAYMAKCGVGSRRSNEELILQGRVMVNNKTVREMGTKVGPEDIVQVDGETIELVEKKYYIALNKPKGYVCTNYDPNETKYARELIGMRDMDLLFHVGRLDKESNGLILFTNDGQFGNAMMHPKYEVEKEYIVKLDRPVDFEDLNKALDVSSVILGPLSLTRCFLTSLLFPSPESRPFISFELRFLHSPG